VVIDGKSIVEAYTKRRLLRDFSNSPPTGRGYKNLGYLLLKAHRMAVTKTEFIVLQKAA